MLRTKKRCQMYGKPLPLRHQISTILLTVTQSSSIVRCGAEKCALSAFPCRAYAGVHRVPQRLRFSAIEISLWESLFMPVHCVIDKERRLVITTGRDRVTFAEIKAHQDQLKNDPDFTPEYNQLIDSTAVTAVDVSIVEAEELARSGHFFSPSSRRAWFATDPFIFGIARGVRA